MDGQTEPTKDEDASRDGGLRGELVDRGVPVELNVLPREAKKLEKPVCELVLAHALRRTHTRNIKNKVAKLLSRS